MTHRPIGGYHQRNCVFCLWFIIAEPLCLQYLSGVFKFAIRQLDRETFKVNKWVSLEFLAGQQLKLRQSRYK